MSKSGQPVKVSFHWVENHKTAMNIPCMPCIVYLKMNRRYMYLVGAP